MVDVDAPPVESEHEPVEGVTRGIRQRLRGMLRGWSLPEDVVSDAIVVVEELVNNVVDHAGTRFRLIVDRNGEVLRIAVRDHSPRLPERQERDVWAERGRGLVMVEALTERWGCHREPEGKTVWAELAATA